MDYATANQMLQRVREVFPGVFSGTISLENTANQWAVHVGKIGYYKTIYLPTVEQVELFVANFSVKGPGKQ